MRAPPERLARALGHGFTDSRWLEQALTHRSAGADNNERLEFLGDALLGFVVADALFQRFPQAKEGQLSRLRASLVNKGALATLARGLDIGDYLNLGAGELRSGGQSRDSILADALEALFGAVYLDAGYAAAEQVIHSVMREPLAGAGLAKQAKDPKTRLQEYLQSCRRSLPVYGIQEVSGSQHAQTFRVVCALADSGEETTGIGRSRRRAEQDAAEQMLRRLGDA